MTNAKLEKAWRSMEEQDDTLSPFLYFDYLKYIFQYTAYRNLMYSPAIVCVESSNGEILMIAPMKKNICNGKLKMLGDIQGCGTADFLFCPDLPDEIARECIKLFIKEAGTKFKLGRINENSLINSWLTQYETSKSSEHLCVKIKFTEDVDLHLKGLSSSVKQNLRTAYNRMKRDKVEYELRVWLPGSHIEHSIKERIMQLYLKRLLGKYKRYKVGNLFYKTYKTIFYKYIKHDTYSLYELSNSFHAALFTQGKLMCFMSGFTNHKKTKVVIPRLAIDDTYKFYSPGYMLICETMKRLATDTTIREIDLSRGIEKYKTDLGGELYHTNSYIFTNHHV